MLDHVRGAVSLAARVVEDLGGSGRLAAVTVWAVGETPRAAVEALAKERGWDEVTNFREEDVKSEVRAGHGEWFATFRADGTSMKAAGSRVPGGFVASWWK